VERRGESSSLVGRARECALIDAWLQGPGSFVLELVGEPGIGKSRLLAELAARARRDGYLVLCGQAMEPDRTGPFGIVIDALEDFLAGLAPTDVLAVAGPDVTALGQVFPVFAKAGPVRPIAQYRLHGAIRSLLERLAEPSGLLVLLDDLHRSDDATIELLTHLLRRPPGAVRFAIAYRPRQVNARLHAALASCPELVSVTVGPLAAAAADRLLDRQLGVELRRRICLGSGGNPLYLHALARLINAADGPGEDGALRTLRADLACLTPMARRMAWAASVMGDPFEVWPAADVAEIDHTAVPSCIDELVARDLVRPDEDGRRMRFRHPLLRSLSYQDAAPGWRFGAHQRAVDALRRTGASPEALAPHVRRTAAPGDRDAVDVMVAAARGTIGRRPLLAAHWLRAALSLMPRSAADEPRRLRLLGELAQALCLGGELHASRAVAHEVLRLHPKERSDRRAATVTVCAMVERLLGHHRVAQALVLTELAGDAPARTPATAAMRVEAATASLMCGDFAANAEWARRALEVADTCDDRAVQVRALAFLALASLDNGDVGAAREDLDRAALIVDALPDGALADGVEAVLWLAWSEVSLGRYADAVRHLRRAEAVALACGRAYVRPLVLSCLAMGLRWLGRLPEAMACTEQAVAAADRSGSDDLRTIALATRSWIANWVGEVDVARAAALEATRLALPLEGWFPGVAAAMLGAARASDDPDGWVDLTLAALGGPDLLATDPWSRITWLEVLVRAELARGRPAAAAEWAERAAAAAAGMDYPAASGMILLARAEADAAREVRAGAAARALHAATILLSAGCRLDAARAYLLAGETLEDSDAARAALRTAEDLFAECGAGPHGRAARRARRRLDARGPRRAASDPPALTSREAQVAALVAEGLSNREVARQLGVAAKTVEMHLARVFAKLGVASRAGVASAVARKGPRQG